MSQLESGETTKSFIPTLPMLRSIFDLHHSKFGALSDPKYRLQDELYLSCKMGRGSNGNGVGLIDFSKLGKAFFVDKENGQPAYTRTVLAHRFN